MTRTCDPNVPAFVSHLVPIPECCPVSKNPREGSAIRISYRPQSIVVPVEALEEKVRGYIGGFESIRGMEEMIQDIARWCSVETGVAVSAVADLIIQPPYGGPQQTMRVSARQTPTPETRLAVPEGYILVPIEPTEVMIDQGQHVNSEWLNDNAPIGERRYREPAKAVYKAMIALAATEGER